MASLTAGVDVGSVTTAAVVYDPVLGRVVGRGLVATGARCAAASEEALRRACETAGSDHIAAVVATGYGRERVAARTATVTEVTCHARGIAAVLPEARTLIDVGGQDCKAALLGRDGQVLEFAMNDRCAAGTGRFFENMCRVLEVDLEQFGPIAAQGDGTVDVSHVCAVFAESEVVGLLAQGWQMPEIAAALCRSAARQVASLVRKIGVVEPVALSGGVAHNIGFRNALMSALGVQVLIPEYPEYIGAFGAALLAAAPTE